MEMSVLNAAEIILLSCAVPPSVSMCLSDFKYRYIRAVVINYSLIVAGIARIILLATNETLNSPLDAFTAAAILLLLFIYFHFKPSPKIGIGDVKYMLLLAILLGSSRLVVSILCGSVLALLASVIFSDLRNRNRGIPLIPFLFAGGILSIFVSSPYYLFLNYLLDQ